MLTAEQSAIVRTQIAKVLNIDVATVVPAARLFADLGATIEHLKPMRLAIEAALPVQIEPIVDQINLRTGIHSQGLVTYESKAQIVAYLDGGWPGLPEHNVSFLDLFTVGMQEAIISKALSGNTGAVNVEPLQLSPDLTTQVHEVVAKFFKLPIEKVHSDLDLTTTTKSVDARFALALSEIGGVLGIDFAVEMDRLKRGLGEIADCAPTPLTMQRMRQLVPTIDSLSDETSGMLSTVGVIERICAAAIARRESPEVARSHGRREYTLGLYFAKWNWADQDWWSSLPDKLGTARFRLYLCGMLRAAFMKSGNLFGDENEMLEIAEKFAEKASNPVALEKKFQILGNHRRMSRTPYGGGLRGVLNPELKPEDGGGVLNALEVAYQWKPEQVVAAARQWQAAMISPLKDPGDFQAAWCTPEVVALAHQMHDSRAFIEFPKLGDLLALAGCDVDAILDHCRLPDRRHLRGDWLIEAILAAATSAPQGKSAGRTAKPKKAKLPAMSKDDKKRFKELEMKERGGIPLAAAWTAVWQSNADRETFRKMVPSLPAAALDVLAGMYPALRTTWPDVAVVRRVLLQSVSDLPATLSLHARICLLKEQSRNSDRDLHEHFRNAFAAGDEAALRWALAELPITPLMETDFDNWTYLAFRAIAARDATQIQTSIDRWPHPADSKKVSALDAVLLTILRGVPSEVVAALNKLLDEQRKSEGPEGFGVFSITAHAAYRAAHWHDPSLVANFDVNQPAPWDAEYHAISMAASDPLKDFDLSTTPPQLRDLLLTEAIPQWLRDVQNCPQNARRDYEVGMVLTSVGSKPDSVWRQVLQVKQDWTRAEFDHRSSMLPMTLACRIHTFTCDQIRESVGKAGATVEVVKLN